MKKNKMLRMASALLILVMLTTCIVGSTFAKYTTTGSASDTARVAKWGVVINTSGSLYSNAYAANAVADKGDLPTAWEESPAVNNITVATKKNTGSDNIVAPGTKSAGGLNFAISGTPEVAVRVTTSITAEDIFLAKGTYGVLVPAEVSDGASLKRAVKDHADCVYGLKNGAYTKQTDTTAYAAGTAYFILTDKVTVTEDYFPVKYALEGGATGTADTNTAVAVAETLAKAIKDDAVGTPTGVYKTVYTDIGNDYPASTDLSDTSGPHFGNEKLSWEWPIESESDEEAYKKEINAADTILGNLIAARNDTTVTYKVVAVGTDDSVTELKIETGADDYTVKDGTNTVVANLRTVFNITLTVAQID